MTLRDINDAKNLRDRAAKIRVMAEGYADKEAALALMRIEDDYDKVAARAEKRSRSNGIAAPSLTPRPSPEKSKSR
jgi:hypothetical protein